MANRRAGQLGHARIGRAHAALHLRADDRLRRRVGARRPLGEPAGEARARPRRSPSSGSTRLTTFQRSSVSASYSVAGHDELAGPRGPGPLGQPLRAAHRRREPHDGLDEAEARRLGGQQQVARQRQLEGGGQAQRVRGEDGRERAAPRRCGSSRAARVHSSRRRLRRQAVEEVHVDPAADRRAPRRARAGRAAGRPRRRRRPRCRPSIIAASKRFSGGASKVRTASGAVALERTGPTPIMRAAPRRPRRSRRRHRGSAPRAGAAGRRA